MDILCRGTWPQMTEIAMQIPKELKDIEDSFERFYKHKNSNRQLTWLYLNGSVEVAMLEAAKKYQLVVNVAQASVLCLFNEKDVISCGEIKTMTRIPVPNFKAAMTQLANPKIKVLIYSGKKPDFGDSETLKPNPKFTSGSIRLNLIPKKTFTKKSVELTEEDQKQAKIL